jgi:hypothetical protein
VAADQSMPCPYLAGGQLCSRPRGHRGRHQPQVPEVSTWRLSWILGGLADPAWWRPRPRCPECRTAITGCTRGTPAGPVVVPAGQGPGPCAEVISEYPVTLGPCGHQFRRIMRTKDYR